MINTKALREKILDLAMRGKLVPQDPTDEPASVLLDKIKEEKVQLIKDKKIKKEKVLPEISKEEIPYEIPDSWEWVRIGEIQLVKGGKRVPKGKQLVDYPTEKVYLRVADMKNGTINISNLRYATMDIYEAIKNYTISSSDLYLSIAGTIGNVGIIPTELNGSLLTENAVKIVNFSNLNSKFILYMLQAKVIQEQFNKLYNQVAQPKLSIRSINQTISLVPPIEEQQRIVAKIEELFALIDTIESNQLEFKQLAEELDKKVLDLAMRGKLVPQDPTDEPASVLLDKIKEEKVQLIKDKKIKKEKVLPEISKEEIPYEIPDSWEWVRLVDIGSIFSGGTPKTTINEFWEKGTIPWITPAIMGKSKSKIFNSVALKHITEQGLNASSAQLIPGSSIVYSSRAPIGHINIVPYPYSTNQGCKSVTPIKVDVGYLYYCLVFRTPDIKKRASGTTFKEISGKGFSMTVVSIPPLAEQKRIVAKIEMIREIIQRIDFE